MELSQLALSIGLSAGELVLPQRVELSGALPIAFRKSSALLLEDSFFDVCLEFGATYLIECGAHDAGASKRFLSTSGRGAIAAEANPYTFNQITLQASKSGVDVRNVGVGRQPGKGHLLLPKVGGTRTPLNASFLQKPLLGACEEVEVEITTIDMLANELPKEARIVLWIDVEGMAHDVLLGGSQLIADPRCGVIFVEVEDVARWEGQSLSFEVNDLLTTNGFTPVMRDAEFVGQYNILYIRREMAMAVAEISIAYWMRLSHVKLAKGKRGNLRNNVGKLKRVLVSSRQSRFSRTVNAVAAFLGSKSSRQLKSDSEVLQRR